MKQLLEKTIKAIIKRIKITKNCVIRKQCNRRHLLRKKRRRHLLTLKKKICLNKGQENLLR